MIDHFTLDEFENFIQSHYDQYKKSFEWGEWEFYIPQGRANIVIRSSISAEGSSADTGENSIRVMLKDADHNSDRLLFKDDSKYVTRVSGWQDRLQKLISLVQSRRLLSGDCRKCGRPHKVFLSKSERNPNRLFAKCEVCDTFFWLDSMQPHFEAEPEPLKSQEKTVLEQAEEASQKVDISALTPLDLDDMFSAVTETAAIIPATGDWLLNEEQKAFVFSPIFGASRLLAGPGSGKSHSIKYRYAHLVDEGVFPGKIVAVTFNEQMATVLRQKILELLPFIAGSSAEKAICTIHAFCRRSLVEYGHWQRNVTVPKDYIVKNAMNEILRKQFPDPADRPLWNETLDAIYTAKAHGRTTLEQFYEFFVLDLGLSEFYAQGLTAVFDAWEVWRRGNNAVLFGDMPWAMEVLMGLDSTFLGWLRRKYSHVIIDEGQDTNHQAMRILTQITDNFSVVGDVNQLLYRFAGATPEANLLDGFVDRFPEGKTFKLGVNHRSGTDIVKAADMIRYNYDVEGGPYSFDTFIDMRPYHDFKGEITFGSFDNSQLEARAVAEEIATIEAQEPGSYGKVFVAARTRAYSAYVEAALMSQNIPYINTSGSTFWLLPHVSKMIDILRVVVDPHDKINFAKVYQIPSSYWTVPWSTMDTYGEYIPARLLRRDFLTAYPSYSAIAEIYDERPSSIPRGFQPGVEDMIAFYREISVALETEGIASAMLYIWNFCLKQYYMAEDGVDRYAEGGGREDDIMAAIEVAADLRDAKLFFDLVDKSVDSAQANKDKDWKGRVVIATIHKLKGMERDFVFLIGAATFDQDRAEGQSMVSILPHTFAFVDPPDEGKLGLGGGCRMEDERCLFFVAITRAIRSVYVFNPLEYRGRPMQASEFVSELSSVL